MKNALVSLYNQYHKFNVMTYTPTWRVSEIKDFIECKTNHSERMNCHMNTTGSCVCTCKEGYDRNMELADDHECEGIL